MTSLIRKIMKIGSLVIKKDGTQLYSGSQIYQEAIIVSLNPFILISTEGDMIWNHQNINDFQSYKNIVLTEKELEPYLKKIT